ncbi:DUF7638 domain-containing protein [Chitinophaga ginsengisoli]|uniref:Uncharacterized protein n=1 Tax=Chitinophaga ginsengisoli TaxID=363837 RepID=A0A2P8FX98_9BACT|nr:hypothetical protein [Chitinophaga ginsengisoli]PSL26343.1 hypothetical protein CLV42_11154 [Chitinophaga ginsengisoli]
MQPTTRVYRKQIIEGVSIPALIHNDSYFFTDLDVYEDGRVSCWNFEDLEHFKKDVRRGWVALSVPENEYISIHGLGKWSVKNASWTFDSETFIEYVSSLIKELNPHMENIFKYRQKVVKGVRIGETGTGIIYKPENPKDIFPEKIEGNSTNLLYRSGDEYYLVKATVFADLKISLNRLEKPLDLTFAELQELVDKKVVLTELPAQARVCIYGLGSFNIGECGYVIAIDQKLLEIQDQLRELRGEPGSKQICIEAYNKYLENPVSENKEQLKVSYENVPAHERMYLGDMDTKDIPIRMIIYGEQEIENWSHYRVAKARGMELPVIRIPKQKD